jgi:hypothetical protein
MPRAGFVGGVTPVAWQNLSLSVSSIRLSSALCLPFYQDIEIFPFS